MGTYPPRECGIATFNQDLLHSSQRNFGSAILCQVAALNFSPLDTYIYPKIVEWEMDQEDVESHHRLALQINSNPNITGVIIQHEYGIFGGLDGEIILNFMRACHKPMITTLHTVLPKPSAHMKQVTVEIIQLSSTLVVLTQRSKKILELVYPNTAEKIHVIPHGIHPTQFSTTNRPKQKLKLENHTILSTFGLLSRSKGIEYVLQALPSVIKKHPDILYLILGETHPLVRRSEGETYRKELAQMVTDLKLKKHVKFYEQYLSLSELLGFLKATDIYISPSVNPNQAVSGTLSYALGAGRAVVSTSFAQAEEIITDEIGRLVPMKSPQAYTAVLNQLLDNKSTLKSMHKAAYANTRQMLWSNIASEYLKLLTQNIIPPINLSHLQAMTDDFGLFQFATIDQPNKKFGYTLDDNARALVVCSWLQSSKDKSILPLMTVYLNLIKSCQRDDGTFINYLDYDHKQATDQNLNEDLEDATARAMWALSEVIGNKLVPNNLRQLSLKLFSNELPHIKNFRHLRSTAMMIKALVNVEPHMPQFSKDFQQQIHAFAELLTNAFTKNRHKSWLWFDSYLGYNNAVVSEAMMIAGEYTQQSQYASIGFTSLNFLIDKTFSSNRYLPIGQSKWYINQEERSEFDQQPEEPASMILALETAFHITYEKKYTQLAKVCFSWFLGNNSLNQSLYNYNTGGCFDGLHRDRVNQNQGAESLVSYLLSRLAITRM